jgi:hypothetical protein
MHIASSPSGVEVATVEVDGSGCVVATGGVMVVIGALVYTGAWEVVAAAHQRSKQWCEQMVILKLEYDYLRPRFMSRHGPLTGDVRAGAPLVNND